jgi:uncharacterized protein YdeI (YjbR/CyaY-like superfamily)
MNQKASPIKLPRAQYFKTRAQWRAWLKLNHKKSKGLWLGYYKKHTKKASVTYEEAVQEALCWGWIDSQIHRVDDERYIQRYTPRHKDSIWSETNRKRVALMIKTGQMTNAGLEKIKLMKQPETDEATRAQLAKDPATPPDLKKALKADKKAWPVWQDWAPSYRKTYIWFIADAKRACTRQNRIKQVVKRVAQGLKPGF